MLELSRQKITIILMASLLLLVIPIIVWATGWQWQMPESYDAIDAFLYVITQTGTAITYAFITCFALATLLSIMVKKTPWVIVFFTAFILLVGTQVIKTGLKSFYKEPRPYMGYLVEHNVNVETFYQEKRSERKVIVSEALKDNTVMPIWLKAHWEKETGYSFPSGHAAFAVCWLMVFILMLPMNRKRDWAIVSVMFVWAGLMIISRLRLGMHYPVDVLVSTLYVPMMCVLYAKVTQCPKVQYYLNGLVALQHKIFHR